MQHKDNCTRTPILEDRHLQNAAYLQENYIMRKKQYKLLMFSSSVLKCSKFSTISHNWEADRVIVICLILVKFF